MRQGHPAAWLGVGLALFIGALLPSTALAQYTRLQVLLPGETAAPGTGTGKSGTPRAQVAGLPFTVTVRACDSNWNTVTSISNSILLMSSDASATLPGVTQLNSGQQTFQVTFNAGGNFTIQARDETDGTIPDGFSASVASQVLDRFEFAGISQKHKYAGTPDGTQIWARTPNGATVTGFNGTVNLRELTSYGEGRISPATVTFTNGTWSGNVTMYRADETSINRGNVNMVATLPSNPAKNGTSDPFVVHPAAFSRLQVIVPGMTPMPGSVSGYTGSAATQAVGTAFTVGVYATDAYWNPVPSADNINLTATGSFTKNPQNGPLTSAGDPPGGFRTFSVTLNTVGTQTVTVTDQTNGSITPSTSPSIQVIPAGTTGFAFTPPITGPLTAGVPTTITIRAVDSGGNTVPSYAADAILTANTGTGSVTPSQITFANGEWTGQITIFGAGGAVALTCADYSAPPKTGTSNNFVVNPGPYHQLQVILPGESPAGGTAAGKTGTPTTQTAGTSFNITVRATDQYWNLVPGVNNRIGLTSTDTFAWMTSDTTLANGQRVIPVRLHKSGNQTITATDLDDSNILTNTSSQVLIVGGAFARVLVLAPGETVAPGTTTGRSGTATDQNINYAFTLTVLATDQWWNPVGGATDVVRITSGDPLAQLPPDEAMVNGTAEMTIRLSTGGFQQISVSDVTNPSRTGSTTQVRAITSGFHLEATINQATARAGEPFTVYIRVVNDAGAVIQEINSAVTLEVRNAGNGAPGRGTLTPVTGQLTQGDWLFNADYTFAEAIQIMVRDDAGNAPATSNPITITPGVPAVLRLSSTPPWVGLNKHATLTARVEDAYENGVPGRTVAWSLLSGTGTLTVPNDSTNAEGFAYADFLSPRAPETDRIRATSGSLSTELDLAVAYVDPAAAAGFVTSYPNPFHAGSGSTTIAYKLEELATVNLRIFTTSGSLVRHLVFPRGTSGGNQGLNEYVWDGKNGKGEVVSSGGYVAFIEAQGTGETLHVIKHKIAVVR